MSRFRCVVLAVLLGCFVPSVAVAQSTSQIASALSGYFKTKFGSASPVVIDGSVAVVSRCETASCRPVRWVMAAYHDRGGDDGAQAILKQSWPCASCFVVLSAGGGVLGLADLERLGVDARSARELEHRFNPGLEHRSNR